MSNPVEKIDIASAFAQVRAAVGKETFMRITADFEQEADSPKIKSEWSVYDGSTWRFFTSESLTEAVNLCLAAHPRENT